MAICGQVEYGGYPCHQAVLGQAEANELPEGNRAGTGELNYAGKNVLGCYWREDEVLCLAAREDAALEKAEEELKLNLDWF